MEQLASLMIQPHPNSVMLDVALRYASRGLRVLPLHSFVDGRCTCGNAACDHPGKHPVTKHGVKDATTDERDIRGWFSGRPPRNLGIACGGPMRLVVVDIDDPVGQQWYKSTVGEDLEQTSTIVVRTGVKSSPSGTWSGRHAYFTWPLGVDLPTSRVKVFSGVDLRSEGTYVVAPPSFHKSGHFYDFMGDGEDAEIAEMPKALVEAIQAAQVKPARGSKARNRSLGARTPSMIPEGMRNDRLFRIACARRSWGLDEKSIHSELRQINEKRCCPPLDDAEVSDTAASACRYPPGQPPLAGIIAGDRLCTDKFIAEQIEMEWRGFLHWCADWGCWFVWSDSKGAWQRDQSREIERWAWETIEGLRGRVAQDNPGDSESAGKLLGQLGRYFNSRPMQDALKALQCVAGVAITSDSLDTKPDLVSCGSTTIDLTTGEARPSSPADFNTRVVSSSFDPDAACPLWQKCMADWFPDNEVREYVHRALGVCLAGSSFRHKIHFATGQGNNGKSTLFDVLSTLLGDYAGGAPPKLLERAKGERHPTQLATLRGKRLVVSHEWPACGDLDLPLLKQLTGGDKVRARGMRQDFYEFTPELHFWVTANQVPVIRESGTAATRRFWVVPFTSVIPDDAVDEQLKPKLLAESPGILNWLLEGARKVRAEGLVPPKAIQDASADLFEGADLLDAFLEEFFVRDATLERHAKPIPIKLIRGMLQRHCGNEGYPDSAVPSPQSIRRQLQSRGLRISDGGGRAKMVHGLIIDAQATAKLGPPEMWRDLQRFLNHQ